MVEPIQKAPPAPVASAMQQAGSLPTALLIGVMEGFIILALTLSFAALVYSGAAASHLVTGSGLFLLGAAAMNLVAAARTSLRGSVMVPQDVTTTVVAVSLAAVIPAVEAPDRFGTVFFYCLLTTAVTGVVMLGLGSGRLGNLVRFIPYPVIGGFLAGTGLLLVLGAVDLVTASGPLNAATTAGLVGAVALAVLLTVVLRGNAGLSTVPAIVAGGVGAFYLILLLTGTAIEDARATGLLPDPAGGAGLALPRLDAVDWSAIRSGIGGLATVPLVATLALLLNVTGLEMVSDEDADLNKELRVTGGANLAVALTGTTAGYHTLGISAIAFRMGVASRWVAVACGAVCLIAVFAGSLLVSLLPTPIVGGLLLMVGLGFLIDWLIDGWRRMTVPEYILMLALVAAVVLLGFIPAVLLGMTAAVSLFAIAYSRVDPVRHVTTLGERASSHDRSLAEREVIAAQAASVLIVELQGYLFFGTARGVLARVKQLVESTSELAILVVDLRRTQGIDSTGLASFLRLERLARRNGFELVISAPPHPVARALHGAGGAPTLVDDLDRAIEMAEDHLLAGEQIAADLSGLAGVFGEELWGLLEPNLERMELGAGEFLADLGEGSSGLFLVERGRIAAEIPAGEGRWQRVVSAGPGTILGEVSLYLESGRIARLVAEEPSCVFTLDAQAIRQLEESEPVTAVELHRRLATVLASRLAASNQMLRALLR